MGIIRQSFKIMLWDSLFLVAVRARLASFRFWSPSIRFTGIPHPPFILFGSAEATPTAHLRQQEDSPPCTDFGRLLPKYGQRMWRGSPPKMGTGAWRSGDFPEDHCGKNEARLWMTGGHYVRNGTVSDWKSPGWLLTDDLMGSNDEMSENRDSKTMKTPSNADITDL